METGLLHDYFGNFSTRGERYYYCMEGRKQGEIETNIEMNMGGGGRWEEDQMGDQGVGPDGSG